MPKNREDEKLESSRVEVSLKLLLKGAKKGYTIDELVDDLDDYVVAAYLSVLLDAGANPDKLVSRLDSEEITDNLDKLLDAGANPDRLVFCFASGVDVTDNLDKLLAAGVNPDKLASRLFSDDVVRYLDKLMAAGAKINVDELVGRLDLW